MSLGVTGLALAPAAAVEAAPQGCVLWIVCSPSITAEPAPAPVPTTAAPAAVTTAVAPAPVPTTAAPAPVVLSEVPGAANVLIGLVNGERAAAGLPLLRLRDDLSAFSSVHARAMAEAGDIWHNDDFFTAATKHRFGAVRVGENVASHSGLEAAHAALMSSPGHRANLLSGQFRAVGLGAWSNGRSVFVAQNFIVPDGADQVAAAAAASRPGPAPAAGTPVAAPAAAAPTGEPVEEAPREEERVDEERVAAPPAPGLTSASPGGATPRGSQRWIGAALAGSLLAVGGRRLRRRAGAG